MKITEKTSKRIPFILAGAVLLLFVVGVGCVSKKAATTGPENLNRSQILQNAMDSGLIMNEEEIAQMEQSEAIVVDSQSKLVSALDETEMKNASYDYSGALADVTEGTSYGTTKAVFEDGIYQLYVSGGNLPELEEDMYFEAWVVNRDNALKAVSLGRVSVTDLGAFTFAYKSSTDLTEYSFFVLTSEWDDGNETAGLHVLEGAMKKR